MSDQEEYSPRDYDDDQQQQTHQPRGKGERQVPEQVKSFISAMQRRIANRQMYELQSLYSDDLSDLSDRYFKAQPWPTPEKLSLDGTFALVYKELCYRHIYNRLQPTVTDRIESFSTYCALFDAILAMRVDGPELDLPPVWLWDILDEFVYQFESFHQFRARLSSVSPADIELLKQRPDAWSAPSVLRYLHLIVKKSQLTAAAKPASAAVDADEEESDEDDEGVDEVDEKESDAVGGLFKTLGYLSLVALLRVNCLLGDYNSALKALEPIDLKQKKALFTQLPGCHATMYYFMGFAYLMLRRYVDAVKVFSSFLQFVQRNKQLARKYLQSAVQKRVDKIYGLLSIVFSCTSQRLDEMLHNALKEKSGDRMQRMQKGELAAFEESFVAYAPKFVSQAVPNYSNVSEAAPDAAQLQLSMFLQEMTQRQKLPEIYSYLKLCTAVSVPKLAEFLGTDEDACITWLLALKHKTRNLRWRGGSPLSGDWVQSADVDFYISKDMTHVNEYRPPRRYGQYFIRHILKLEDTLDYMRVKAAARS